MDAIRAGSSSAGVGWALSLDDGVGSDCQKNFIFGILTGKYLLEKD